MGDAYSGPDLDALVAYCFRLAAEVQQPKNILNQCHLWQSTRFDELEGFDEATSWFPRLQHGQQQPLRYQLLPFYSTARWQLAIFDIVNNVVVCYDTMWTSGLPNSTFRVGKVLCAYYSGKLIGDFSHFSDGLILRWEVCMRHYLTAITKRFVLTT